MSCIFCGQTTNSELTGLYDSRFGIAQAYDISICSHCGLEQIKPLPSQNELKQFYESYYNFNSDGKTVYTRLREVLLYSFIYRLWIFFDGDISFHSDKGQGRLLDVGCNEGRGLEFYRRNGFDVEGLEVNETAAHAAREKGFVVKTEPLESYSPSELYDVVVLSNVLEHALDPQVMLKHIHRLLKTGGEVWISCPNSKSWMRDLFGRHWINWHVPFHVVHFSAATLTHLLEANGFKVKTLKDETPTLWLTQSFIAALFSKQGKPTRQLRNPFLVAVLMVFSRVFLFPFLWLGNLLGRGDCLVLKASRT